MHRTVRGMTVVWHDSCHDGFVANSNTHPISISAGIIVHILSTSCTKYCLCLGCQASNCHVQVESMHDMQTSLSGVRLYLLSCMQDIAAQILLQTSLSRLSEADTDMDGSFLICHQC